MSDSQPLSREDRAILDLESPTIVGHTAKLVRIGPRAPDVGALREAIAARLPDAQELRLKLGGAAEAPAWVEDEAIELEHHVADASAGEPLTDEALRAEVARLFTERLDRARPLWRLDRFALPGGGAALLWRIHHALADGTTAMRLARTVLFDPAGDGPGAPPSRHAPSPTPGRHHVARVLERELARSRGSSPFDAAVGHAREVAFVRMPLAGLHEVAKREAEATVNDAVLACVAGGIRSWLEARHGSLGELRVKVPVSLHRPGEDAGNRDSFFVVALPLGVSDPVERLRAIHSETAARKADHDAQELDRMMAAFSRASPHLERFAERIEDNPRRFALNVSNVPGPRGAVSVLGAPVSGIFSLAEIGERHALRVAVVSYAGDLCFGLCGDPDVVPDLSGLAAGITAEADRIAAMS